MHKTVNSMAAPTGQGLPNHTTRAETHMRLNSEAVHQQPGSGALFYHGFQKSYTVIKKQSNLAAKAS